MMVRDRAVVRLIDLIEIRIQTNCKQKSDSSISSSCT